jgi:hypothetical protein
MGMPERARLRDIISHFPNALTHVMRSAKSKLNGYLKDWNRSKEMRGTPLPTYKNENRLNAAGR